MKKNEILMAVIVSAMTLGIMPGTALAQSENLTLSISADIQPGTCHYSADTPLDFNFQQVTPGEISASDKSKRPQQELTVRAEGSTAGQPADNYLACDASASGMKFDVSTTSMAMGADGVNLIALQTKEGQQGAMASGFGIALSRIVESTETPLVLGQPTDVGAAGDFTLRATLVPLKDVAASDMTAGYINAKATLNITYE